MLFSTRGAEWGVIALPECRLQVAPDRFRIPDVMLLLQSHKVTRIVRKAPLLCIEVLSPEDTWAKMRARLNDYLAIGVQHVWCFDPDAREARALHRNRLRPRSRAHPHHPAIPISITIADIFSVLD